MAVSVAAAIPRTVARTSPFLSSDRSKLSHFSSLQFPSELRSFRIRNHCLKSKLRHRTITLVASKKQTLFSFYELLDNSGPLASSWFLLEQVSTSMMDKIQVMKIDTEENPMITDKYKIEALPTFILFRDGKPCDRFDGAMVIEQLVKRIQTSLQVE